MKFPRLLRISNLIINAIFFSLGILVSCVYPEVPKRVTGWLPSNLQPPPKRPAKPKPPPPPPIPKPNQINEVLSGSLALVEAQHTYYVHVTRNTRFALNVKELGSVNDKGGTVMVQKVWNASDAVQNPIPVQGYLFKCMPVVGGPEKKDGFAVIAYPAEVLNWPLYISIIPDAKGGLVTMSSGDTWEIEDELAAKEIRAQLQHGKLNMADLARYSPENFPKSYRIANFKKESR
ncbi:MAG: hypothetical protein IAE77_00805 [Prosthecobacter sp.]|uniref:hypothetical protein n=1 Tax=Prosthecobacter sp. TaxID=1965333 RepID=UPI0019D91342|nr:hypothetical protein [Prosthecobacter sp.]MBE2281978.1 hypothetical protein [Prosthecobacter sp.]